MGRDVCHIGQHNLNINSLEELASDLSKRFQVSVEYGYQDLDSFDFENGTYINTFDNVTLGKAEFPNSDVTLFLSDEFLQKRLIYEQFGEDLFSHPHFTQMHGKESEYREAICNKSYHLREPNRDIYWGTIYNDSFSCDYYDWDARWWNFCRLFTLENDYDTNFDRLNEYRTQLLHFFHKIGGHHVIYCDDYQAIAVNMYSWNDLLAEIGKCFGDRVLNVSEFMKEKKLRNMDDYPPIFYDDFADLLV